MFLSQKNLQPLSSDIVINSETQDQTLTATQLEIHREIIESSKRGHARAQHQLYRLYARAMYNICLRMMNSKEEAEDMLQESFSEAFYRLDSFRHESSFGAWIKKIVIHKCINELKRKKTNLELFEDMTTFGDREADPREPQKELSVENVKNAMQQLPKGSRLIFSLYLLEGYDHQEIAGILDISESTSKSQYMRAKRKTKEILNTQNHEN